MIRRGDVGGRLSAELHCAVRDRPGPNRPKIECPPRISFERDIDLHDPIKHIVTDQGASMAKRSARYKSREAGFDDSSKVHRLFPSRGGWNPRDSDESRDRKYVKNVRAMSATQQVLLDAIDERSVILALGPAGTGKTYLAIAKAVEALEGGRCSRIVLSRPAVEAGESLGFLPGDLQEKLAPYLRPLYDALTERLGTKRLRALLADGVIEVAPVAYMRGRTLSDCYVVIDEAQNCTYIQLKMLLTRLGWRSTMVLTGDPDQTDLLKGMSGLGDIADRLERVAEIAVVRLGEADIVRHPLVAGMLTVL
jgi:phosphate starvation-inducible PhoH-like protein